jgi:hypothetical protein
LEQRKDNNQLKEKNNNGKKEKRKMICCGKTLNVKTHACEACKKSFQMQKPSQRAQQNSS